MKQKIIQKLESYLKDNMLPNGMITKIANELNVSKEYVRQLTQMLGYISIRDLNNNYNGNNKICKNCGIRFNRHNSKVRFCSRDCKSDK